MHFIDPKILLYLAAKPGALPDEIPGLGAGTDAPTTSAQRAYLSLQESITSTPSAIITQLESDLLPVLASMEAHGIGVDVQKLHTADIQAQARLTELLIAIHSAAGEPVNPGSPKDLQRLLFEKMGLAPSKKTKTGYSVDEETLEALAQDYPICRDILEWRHIGKIRSTYLAGLQAHIHPVSGRIHTTFLQTRTSTGRLSSEDPNLQNIPRGGALADAVKSAFIPSQPGWKLVVADYSQVELRVLANLANDENMCARFSAGDDIHEATASVMFPGLPASRERRNQAKTVNFGVVYGQTPFGLAQALKISPKEAGFFIDGFFAAYPRIKPWFETILEGVRKNGYVETFFGRRRAILSINDANQAVRFRAQREAINMPVQGTAADIMKLAMVAFSRYLQKQSLRARLLLQVHDELVVECPENEVEMVTNALRIAMEGAAPATWNTRLTVDIGVGDNWLTAKK